MTDIELVIKIPEEVKQAFDQAENNDLKAGYYDIGGVIGVAIKNGIPLPKGHGRLIDSDFLEDIMWHSLNADKTGARYCVMKFLRNTPTAIEANEEVE